MAKMAVKLIDNEEYVNIKHFFKLKQEKDNLAERVALLELYTELIGSSPENAIKTAQEYLGKNKNAPYMTNEEAEEIFK